MAKVKDFTPDKKNANKGTARGQKQIVSSIQASGVGRSIVTDKNGVIIGGNKSLEAMAEIFGVEAEPIVIKSDGKRPLIHVREDLDLDDPDPNNPARKLAYNDNITSWLSFELDPAVTMADIESGFDFQAIGVSLEELGEMLEGGVQELLNPPNFQPVGADTQPRLDRKNPITCPHCGQEFTPE